MTSVAVQTDTHHFRDWLREQIASEMEGDYETKKRSGSDVLSGIKTSSMTNPDEVDDLSLIGMTEPTIVDEIKTAKKETETKTKTNKLLQPRRFGEERLKREPFKNLIEFDECGGKPVKKTPKKVHEGTYYIYGSRDSKDLNIFYCVDRLSSSFSQNCRRCDLIAQQLAPIFKNIKKPLSINLGVVKNGRIVECMIGLPDEIHNAVLGTFGDFPRHQMFNEMLLTGPRRRSLSAKLVWSLRLILNSLRYTQHREKVEAAYHDRRLSVRLKLLKGISFADLEFVDLKEPITEVWKRLCFQLGQSLGLLENVELLTKKDVALQYPALRDAMKRLELDVDALTKIGEIKDNFCDLVNDLFESGQLDPELEDQYPIH